MEPDPIGVLEAEHRCIQMVVGAVALHVAAIEAGKTPDIGQIDEVASFMRAYADQCHHGKEEALLFPALERRGVPPQGCPLGALKHDHLAGRALVAELAAAAANSRAGVAGATETLVKCLNDLVALYPGHIWKEDYLLFPMAGKVLTGKDRSELAAEFERADASFGAEKRRRLEEWAGALASKALEA